MPLPSLVASHYPAERRSLLILRRWKDTSTHIRILRYNISVIDKNYGAKVTHLIYIGLHSMWTLNLVMLDQDEGRLPDRDLRRSSCRIELSARWWDGNRRWRTKSICSICGTATIRSSFTISTTSITLIITKVTSAVTRLLRISIR